MIVKEALERLNRFAEDADVLVSDYVGNVSHPCCVRLEADKVVVDIVHESLASLGQEGFTPLETVELKQKLETMNRPFHEIVFSNYAGQLSNAQCVRQEVPGTVLFDIDGLSR